MSHNQLRALVWGQAYAAMLAKVFADREWDQENAPHNAEKCADATLEAFDRRWPVPKGPQSPPIKMPLIGPSVRRG